MKNLKLLLAFALIFVYQFTQAQPGVAFEPGCALPFQSIAIKRPIDDACGIKGTGTSNNTAANELQNSVKNNFCATGAATSVTVTKLKELHMQVKANGITYGNYLAVPADRSGLRALGEGTVVSYTGYINAVKYSNVGTGETVNCKRTTAEDNDIHIELAYKKNETVKCKRISAEISPHYRPLDWTVDKLKEVKSSSLRIRLTGQLFFDASHTACADNNPDGHRASSWEIHPVYRIEVYMNSTWTNLHETNFPDEDE